MKTLTIFLLGLWTAALIGAPAAGQSAPGFAPGQHLLSNGAPILSNNAYSAPAVYDWNGDGAKDLLVGTFYNGNVCLFINVGPDNDPVFAGGVLLKADGTPISVGYG